MKNIVVLYGGESNEHEISLRSAVNVIRSLDREKYRVHPIFIDQEGCFVPLGPVDTVEGPEDLVKKNKLNRLESVEAFCAYVKGLNTPIVIPCLHGHGGEDGQIQGFLQTLGLPYVGCGILSSALCMDKGYANQVFRDVGLAQAKFLVYSFADYIKLGFDEIHDQIKETIGLPCYVKSANSGSSIGVSLAGEDKLKHALENAFIYDRRIVVEEAIKGKELEVSVLGNESPEASLPGSYTFKKQTLDYDAKYNDVETKENVPHPLTEAQNKAVRDLAIKAYKALNCRGLARCDIFMTEEGEFLINEINTFPGMTPTSLAPKLWTELTDMTFSDYLDKIIHLAEEEDENRKKISYRRQS